MIVSTLNQRKPLQACTSLFSQSFFMFQYFKILRAKMNQHTFWTAMFMPS